MPLKRTPRFLSRRAAQPVHLLSAAAVALAAAVGIGGHPCVSPFPWSLARAGGASGCRGLQGLGDVPLAPPKRCRQHRGLAKARGADGEGGMRRAGSTPRCQRALGS